MPDFTSCPQCHTRYRTAGMPAGKKLRCKKCRTVFVVSDEFRELPPGAPNTNPNDSEHALPAALGDRSSLVRANFSGGVSLPGSSAQGTFIGASAGSPKPSQPAGPDAGDDDERYVVEDEIARGGMGAILRAVDRDIRREVAMKVMLDDADERKRARFVEEAQVTGQLEHPNIVPVHELGVDAEGRMFFTMKLVQGQSLAEVLKAQRSAVSDQRSERQRDIRASEGQSHRGQQSAFSGQGPMPLGRLLNAFINICNAMAFAHAKGVVHRDLKPANIMLGDFGEVLVMDWGLAKVLAGGEERVAGSEEGKRVARGAEGRREQEVPGASVRDEELRHAVSTLRKESGELTQDGTIIGTPHYMPPEQADGKIEEIDARSDIYSLGAILYEVLTLKPPVEGNNIYALMKNVSDGSIAPPDQRTPKRSIPKELSAITMKALARSKGDRYQRAEDLRRDIELFIEGRAVSAKEDTFAESVVKLAKRNKTASIVAAAAFVLLSLGGGVAAWINYEARRVAEAERQATAQALADYKAEKEAKEHAETARRTEQRKSVPAFLNAARLSANQKNFDDALAQIAVAIEYAPDLAEARLFKAQLHIIKDEYPAAVTELDRYLEDRSDDTDAAELRELSARAVKEKNLDPRFAAVFERQKAWAFSECKVRTLDRLLPLCNKRLQAAWPGVSLKLNNEGSATLDWGRFDKKTLRDLSPLAGMPVSVLDLSNANVTDLSPLQGIPVTQLNLRNCSQIKTLLPLRGMQLTSLELCECGQINDLTPLKGMPLTRLILMRCGRIMELSPLKGMRLRELDLGECSRIRDLSPLTGMPLISLNLYSCDQVRDLAPLKDMSLTSLELYNCRQVKDLVPLKGMFLTQLGLRACVQIWDLTPLKGMPLTCLNLDGCNLIKDLSPLKGMPLTELYLLNSGVTDLTPLEGMQLGRFTLSPKNIRQGIEVVRNMKSLGKIWIGGENKEWSPAEFWKHYDAGDFNK